MRYRLAVGVEVSGQLVRARRQAPASLGVGLEMARRGDGHQQLGVVRVRPVAFAILDADELFERCGGRGEVPADDTAAAACRSPATGKLVRHETVLVEVGDEVE